MSRHGREKTIGGLFLMVSILLIVIIIAINVNNSNTTGDITVSGNEMVAGIKCIDTELQHPVFEDIRPIARVNTITATFINDNLSSIMYRYDGTYQSENEAKDAKVMAEADYNLILANEYGVKINIFTHTFMSDKEKVSLVVTDNSNKVTSRTAPYFLLDSSTEFPNTLEALQKAYEAKGFSCTVINNDK